MILKDLMAFMETVAPKALAGEWDNVGLLVGDPDKEIRTVFVTLDADRAAIAKAKEEGADVLVTHHPLLFAPVRTITAPGALYDLVSSGMALFAAHTNLDAAPGGVNDALCAALGLRSVTAFETLGRVGELREAMTPEAFAAYVNEALGTRVQMKSGNRPVKTVAVVGGSGGDFLPMVTADAFVTGEMKHHEWLEAPDGLTVLVGGHYHTEVVVLESLAERIKAAFPSLSVVLYGGNAPYETV